MYKYKVSIIIPVYNVERYLEECFESITNQTHKNIEIIFIDDGSTDNSGSILDSFRKKDIRVKVFHKRNGGVSSAKNVGIKNAEGDYVTFVDPDDYIMEDYVEYLLKLVTKENAEIALSKKMYDNYDMKQDLKDKICTYSSEEALVSILSYNINVAVWNKLYKLSFIKSNNILFYEDIFMGEGFNFNILAFQKAKKIIVGHHKIYFYRRDNLQSATTKFRIDKWENALFAIERIKDNLKSNSSKKVNKALLFAYWRTNVDAFTLMYTSGCYDKYKDFQKRTLKVGRKFFYIPFLLKTSKEDKVRGCLMLLFPKLLPKLLIFRRNYYNVNIKN